jgi:hypothetical protein
MWNSCGEQGRFTGSDEDILNELIFELKDFFGKFGYETGSSQGM